MPQRLLLLLTCTTACGEVWQAEPLDRVCLDVGYSISAVAYACSSSQVEAQAAYDAFEERYRCRVAEVHGKNEPDDGNGRGTWANDVPFEVYYTCPQRVGDISCSDYADYAADDFAGMDAWLGVAPACATILEGADGSRLPSLEEP